MNINGITGQEAVPKSSLSVSRDYVNEISGEDREKTQLEEIRDENKETMIDARA